MAAQLYLDEVRASPVRDVEQDGAGAGLDQFDRLAGLLGKELLDSLINDNPGNCEAVYGECLTQDSPKELFHQSGNDFWACRVESTLEAKPNP